MYEYEHKKIVDAFTTIETKFPVEELMYRNIEIWPYIKFQFNIQFITNTNLTDTEIIIEKSKTFKQKIGGVILAFRNYRKLHSNKKELLAKLKQFSIQIEAQKNKNIFITFNSFRHEKINGKYFNAQSDAFMSAMKNSNDLFTAEFTHTNNTNLPHFSESINFDVLKELAEFECSKDLVINYCKMLFSANALRNKSLVKQQEFSAFLRREGIDLNYNIDDYLHEIDKILKLKKVLKKYIGPINPKFIAFPVYFASESFAATLYCKEAKIPCIEVQHGAYAETIYEFHCKIPNSEFKLLPNYFLSWDANQANIVNRWTDKIFKKKAFVLGINPLKFWRKNIAEFTNDNFTALEPLFKKNELIHVLYTISDKIDEKIPELILKTQNNVFWYLRNHPRASSTNLKFIKELEHALHQNKCVNYDIDNSTRAPLYSLLDKMDYHLTSISSVVIEAKSLGITSVIINISGIQLFSDVYDTDEYIKFETNVEKIIEIITEKPKAQKTNSSINEPFFESVFEQIKQS